ncbi:MAG: 4-hydroxy-tetrahydrodipicolinate reductase [Endozoicomonadaceae bacterium]|nr:4-hydroxy-tetrahydrodipicolinate reductase [Endozoicomonadaceae bacterium]
MIRIAVIGAGGRMGREVIKAILNEQQSLLTAALCRKNDTLLGIDTGKLINGTKTGVTVTDNPEKVMQSADALIDFTTPQTTLSLLPLCQQYNKGIVIGTTGFSVEEKQTIQVAAKSIPIVFAPNMSTGVNLMFKLLQVAAKTLGKHSDIEIIEKHHRNKQDAPSGTALKMGEIIADVLNRSLNQHAVYGRHGTKQGIRPRETIGFSSIRAGDIVGEHTALFAGEGEQIEITHTSSSRNHYAAGAVQAALWLANKTSGLYDMMDVLDL